MEELRPDTGEKVQRPGWVGLSFTAVGTCDLVTATVHWRSLHLPADPTPTPSQVRVHQAFVCALVPTKFGRDCGRFPGRDISLFLKGICRCILGETDSFKMFLISLISQ